MKKMLSSNRVDNKSDGVRVIGINNEQRQSSTVTFKDTPTGVIREVTMKLDQSFPVLGRQASSCEILLGIVPGHFSCKKNSHSDMSYNDSVDNRIMVQCLLPGSPAMKNEVKIGEWLMEIDNIPVDFTNLSSVIDLLQIPCEVKLTLQKIAIQLSPKRSIKKIDRRDDDSLVRWINQTNQTPNAELQNILQQFLFCALYLAMDCDAETAQHKEAVLYQYPGSVDGIDGPLIGIYGLFITLTQVLRDITGQSAMNSSIIVKEQLIHVSYIQNRNRVLVLAVPANRMSFCELNEFSLRIKHLLTVIFGSIEEAFSAPENSDSLDHLFLLEFKRSLLLSGNHQLSPFFNCLPNVHAIAVSEETKIIINNQLSKLESADFGEMSEYAAGLRRLYNVSTSCFFYRGYLVASHLDNDDLLDVWQCLTSDGVLNKTLEDYQPPQVVFWKEVHLTRLNQNDTSVPGYICAKNSRWFLLAVGLNHAVLCTLLEAGGCSSQCFGSTEADPFYVDHLMCTLIWLSTQGILQQCDSCLRAKPQPIQTNAECFLPTEGRGVLPFSLPKIPASPLSSLSQATPKTEPESILKKKPPSGGDATDKKRQGRGIIYDGDSDHDSHSTGTSEGSPTRKESRKSSKSSIGSDESASSSGSTFFKGLRKNRNLPSLSDVYNLKKSKSATTDINLKVTSGPGNTLFQYINIDISRGIYICPYYSVNQSFRLHSEVISNFHRVALQIHDLFSPDTSLEVDNGKGFSSVKEHGIMFQCSQPDWTDSKRPAPVINYWVVGRRCNLPSKREVYVCFHDSADQNLIEIAFRLNFGVYI